ncbi:MAG: haloacid dehalogenase-like hydrolase [Atopobiaceae bacterium]|nr:haloacid dehalogenase-like hydrolase [Atopobiaceae bacterium]
MMDTQDTPKQEGMNWRLIIAFVLGMALAALLFAVWSKSQAAQSGNASATTGAAASTDANTATAGNADFSAWSEDSASLKTLVDYVEAATTEGSAGYVKPEDRIAVFDLDGTLMCETFPWCFEYMVFADYALNNPNYKAPNDVAAVAQEIVDSAWGEKPKGMSERQAAAAAIAYSGLTPAELEAYVEGFKSSPAEGFDGMTRGEAWYQPMLQVVSYLQANGFDVYIVTATERNIVRGIVAGVLDIDPSHVIGTEYGYTATGQGDEPDDEYTFQKGDKVVFDGTYDGENAKTCKVDAIVREIGKQPVLAFGNSSGDAAMLVYTLSDNANPSASFMVLADDDEREYGDLTEAQEDRQAWEEAGFTIFSMHDDFGTIYGDGVKKVPVEEETLAAAA